MKRNAISIKDKSLALRHSGKIYKALTLDREILRKNPCDEAAYYNLMYQLYTLRLNENSDNYDSEITSTANMLINSSKKASITSDAKQLLIYVYSRAASLKSKGNRRNT